MDWFWLVGITSCCIRAWPLELHVACVCITSVAPCLNSDHYPYADLNRLREAQALTTKDILTRRTTRKVQAD